LISGILALGVAPSRVLDTISTSVARMNASAMMQSAGTGGTPDGIIASHLPEWSGAVPIGRN
jgi:hypothetical protein